MGDKKIHFTRHAIERFKERFYTECKNKTDAEVRREMYTLVCDSKADRSFINNTGYMVQIHNKYGYDLDFEFLRHENIIFVAKKDRANRKIVLTCYPPDNKVFGKRVKFKKKKKKSVSEEMMEYLLTN